MRAVVQRVVSGAVDVQGRTVAKIGHGLVVLVAVTHGDGESQSRKLASRIANLRIFADATGKFNLSALDIHAEILVVSQFTLYADTSKGRRPNFMAAASPEAAEPLIERFAASLRELGLSVECGRFGASMLVAIHNDGPVTVIIDVD